MIPFCLSSNLFHANIAIEAWPVCVYKPQSFVHLKSYFSLSLVFNVI